MDIRHLIILTALLCFNLSLAAQDSSLLNGISPDKAAKLEARYTAAISEKSNKVSKEIDDQTNKVIEKLAKAEQKIGKKLSRVDSVAGHNFLVNSAAKYQKLQTDLAAKASSLKQSVGKYSGWMDTSVTSLKFLSNNSLMSKLPVNSNQITDAVGKLGHLTSTLNTAEGVKQFVRDRRDYIKQALAKYDFKKELGSYNKTLYGYTASVNEAKSMMNDPSKAETKVLTILKQTPSYQQFIKTHGMLAGLFDLPADYSASTANLQNISQVQNLLKSRLTMMGPNGGKTALAAISAAQSELATLRSKYSSLGNTGDLPEGFTPDPVKSLSTKKRLVFSFDMQSVRPNGLLPASSTFTLSTGYKLDSRFTVGVGLSYITSYGTDIRHIRLTGTGAAINGYLDWRIKKSFFLTTSLAGNYNGAIKSIELLSNYPAWQPALLTGIGKTISLKTRFLKSTRVKLCYDWLHAEHIPATNPLVIKTGYSF